MQDAFGNTEELNSPYWDENTMLSCRTVVLEEDLLIEYSWMTPKSRNTPEDLQIPVKTGVDPQNAVAQQKSKTTQGLLFLGFAFSQFCISSCLRTEQMLCWIFVLCFFSTWLTSVTKGWCCSFLFHASEQSSFLKAPLFSFGAVLLPVLFSGMLLCHGDLRIQFPVFRGQLRENCLGWHWGRWFAVRSSIGTLDVLLALCRP